MVSQDLLDILRCPVCVHNEPEGGDLDHRGNWLICRECGRKYPVRDDIPVMLVDEGDRFREIPVEELPEIPPPELEHPSPTAPIADQVPARPDLPNLLLGAAGVLAGLFLAWMIWDWICGDDED